MTTKVLDREKEAKGGLAFPAKWISSGEFFGILDRRKIRHSTIATKKIETVSRCQCSGSVKLELVPFEGRYTPNQVRSQMKGKMLFAKDTDCLCVIASNFPKIKGQNVLFLTEGEDEGSFFFKGGEMLLDVAMPNWELPEEYLVAIRV